MGGRGGRKETSETRVTRRGNRGEREYMGKEMGEEKKMQANETGR